MKKFSKWLTSPIGFKVLIGAVIAFFLLTIIGFSASGTNAADYAKEQTTSKNLRTKLSAANKTIENDELQLANSQSTYKAYKKRMKPFESLSKAAAKKLRMDNNAAQKFTNAAIALPSADSLTVDSKADLVSTRKIYNALTADQKKLVDVTTLAEDEAAMPALIKAKAAKDAAAKKKAADAAAAKKKAAADAAAKKAAAAAEEAKGYETGITYAQLARTPDDYTGKKVKFYGTVVQVMESDGTTEVRLAVNGDYDSIILADYDSATVSSRVLEDDQVTLYGTSAGLTTYESTMGGDITIPSMLVDKIAQ